jgi:mRNA interferase MazF
LIWRGEVYDVDLGQPIGHEPAFDRPAIVVSTDIVDNGPGEIVVVVPVGSKSYGLRSHVEVGAGASGLDGPSYARCDQVRVVSSRRLLNRRGIIDPDEMHSIDQALRFILDL